MLISPVISVVIAAPGAGEKLERSIASALAQTFPSIEVIAAISGDGDVPRYESSPVAVYVISDVNQSWRFGASRTKGRYICFVQAGDQLERTYIEKCAFLLEVGGIDLCGSWDCTVAGSAVSGPRRPPAVGIPRASVVRASALSGWRWSVDRPSLEEQSADLWKRMSESGVRTCLIPEVLVQRLDSAPAGGRYGEDDTGLGWDTGLGSPEARFGYDGLIAGRAGDQSTILLAMPFLTVGGAERVTSQICQQLKALGFRVLVMTTTPTIEGQGDTTAWFEECACGIYHLPRFLNTPVWSLFVCYLIEQHSVGVLWQVGSSYTYDLLPQIRQFFPSLPVVDLLFNPVGHTANYLKYSYLIDHVVTEDASMKEWLIEHGESDEHISIIPNGVDLSWYSPRPKLDWRTREPRLDDDGRFVVGFIGRLSEEKGPDLFLELASLIGGRPGMEFIVYGCGPMEAALRRRASERDLNGRVHLLGFVSGREGHVCCDAVVVCSRLDGRPNVVMESLAMGVPVIASRVGGIPAMMPEGEGGCLIEAGDVPGFAAAIVRLAEDRQLYRRLSESARQRAVAHFSLADGARKFADVFVRFQKRRAPLARALAPQTVAAAARLAAPQRSKGGGSPAFATLWRVVADVKNAVLLCRIKRWGWLSGEAVEYFDSRYYLNHYPDVGRSRLPPFLHYVFSGFREGRDPSASFSTNRYLVSNPDVARAGINPLLHYLLAGRAEGRRGGPLSP
jgi:glycosyltransferase involved in cell wall biosynthesis